MAEFVVRFVFEVIVLGVLELVARAGRQIARAVVPLISRRVLVEPVANNLIIVRRWHGLHQLTDGTPVMGKSLAATFGILLVVCAALVIVLLTRPF